MARNRGRRPGWAPRRSRAERERAAAQAADAGVVGAAGAPSTDVVEPEDALPEITLEQLPDDLQAAVRRAGWSELMPVQAKAMPYLLAGRDLMIQSRTGSGKTAAFLLPILQRFDPADRRCQALILVPTRELARQVTTQAEVLFPEGFQPIAVYGGVGYGPQIEAFQRGAPLVVGTPGRILDHLLKKNLSLEGLRMLVFDEADRMLSMGFYPDMQRLREFLPDTEIDGSMFSATFPPTVRSLAKEFLHEPEFLSLSRDRVHVAGIEHVFYDVPAMKKDRYLVRIIEIENPASALIFCNTKADVHYLTIVLQRFGYDADELSSDLNQVAREKVLARVKSGDLRFLVATDVASRGIDIFELSHVIQYEPPQDPEDYIHRVGRTGRAGAGGEAITLVAGLEKMALTHIGKRYGIDLLERPAPTEEEVSRIVAQRVTTLLEAKLRDRDKLRKERMQRFVPLVKSLGESEDEIRLMAMLLDDYYQDSLHNPPELPDPRVDDGRRLDSGQGGARQGGGRPQRRKRGARGGPRH